MDRKTFCLVAATALMFGLLGCRAKQGEGALIGKWTDPAKTFVLEFRADHTFSLIVNPSGGYSGRWTESGDNVTIYPVIVGRIQSGLARSTISTPADPQYFTLSSDGQTLRDKLGLGLHRP